MLAQIIGAVQPVLEWIKLWWGYITVLAAICAAIYGKAILPFVRRRRAKREKQEKQQQDIEKAGGLEMVRRLSRSH